MLYRMWGCCRWRIVYSLFSHQLESFSIFWWWTVIQKSWCVYLAHNKWLKLHYIPSLNVHLITDSLGLHNICILNRTTFWIKIISWYEIRMVWQLEIKTVQKLKSTCNANTHYIHDVTQCWCCYHSIWEQSITVIIICTVWCDMS